MRLGLILLIPLFSCGQIHKPVLKTAAPSKKEFQWPTPIRDSEYRYSTCDTTIGTIHVYVGNGEIKAKGFVTSCRNWEGSTPIYSSKDKRLIDSVEKAQGFWVGASAMSQGDPIKTAFMVTSKGNVVVEGRFYLSPD